MSEIIIKITDEQDEAIKISKYRLEERLRNWISNELQKVVMLAKKTLVRDSKMSIKQLRETLEKEKAKKTVS